MKLDDPNLLTHVIKYEGDRHRCDRYFMSRGDAGSKAYAHWTTDNLVEANIYDDSVHVKKVRRRVGGAIVLVSKKIFFEAALKGDR